MMMMVVVGTAAAVTAAVTVEVVNEETTLVALLVKGGVGCRGGQRSKDDAKDQQADGEEFHDVCAIRLSQLKWITGLAATTSIYISRECLCKPPTIAVPVKGGYLWETYSVGY